MFIEEEEPKKEGEVNPDALEEVFEGEALLVEDELEVSLYKRREDEDEADEIDIAFQANDEGYW